MVMISFLIGGWNPYSQLARNFDCCSRPILMELWTFSPLLATYPIYMLTRPLRSLWKELMYFSKAFLMPTQSPSLLLLLPFASFFVEFLWLWSCFFSHTVKIFQHLCGNVKAIGPLLDYIWLQCDSYNSSRNFPVPYKCSLNNHVRPYSITVAFLVSHDMLSYHELLQYFTRQRFHVSEEVWAITCIVIMTSCIKIRQHLLKWYKVK